MKWSRREAITGMAVLLAGAFFRNQPVAEVTTAEQTLPALTPFDRNDPVEWQQFRAELIRLREAIEAARGPAKHELELQQYKLCVLFGLATPRTRIPDWDRQLGIEWAHGARAEPLPVV